MSVLYKLKTAQEVRQSIYSQALKKSPVETASTQRIVAPPTPLPETQVQSVKNQAWMFKGIMALLVLLILAVSLVIVLLLRSSLFEKREVKPKSVQLTKPAATVKAKLKTTTVNNSSRPKAGNPALSKQPKKALR